MSRFDHVLRVGTALRESPTGTKPSFYNGTTPLIDLIHHRSRREKVDIEAVKRLLTLRGADVNARGKYATALHAAVEMHSVEVAKLLIEHGADLEARSWEGWTPLVYSFQAGWYLDLPMIALLLDARANPNAVPADGPHEVPEEEQGGWMTTTPLMYACRSSFMEDSPWSLVDVVRLLLRHGADPNRVNGDGETALSLSILRYRHEVVATLLDHGAIVTDAAIAAFATTTATMSNWEIQLRNEGASLGDIEKLRRTETRWSNISWQLSLHIREDDPLYTAFNRIFSDRMEHKQRVGVRVTK